MSFQCWLVTANKTHRTNAVLQAVLPTLSQGRGSRQTKTTFRLATALGLAVALSTVCSAASYTVTDLGTLGGGYSSGFGISANGQVTGQSTVDASGYVAHPFLYDGTMHDLGTLGGGDVEVGFGINASGQVTGQASTADGADRAFLYDGTMHDLGTLGGSFVGSIGYAINADGKVTGSSYTAGNLAADAFLYDGTMHDLGTLGGTYTVGYGINASGQVTGLSLTGAGDGHAFLYDGTMHDLGTLPGGTHSFGYAINASGEVTGIAGTNGDTVDHAFLYDGTMHDLGSFGAESGGQSINASGQVVGWSYYDPNSPAAFLYDNTHGMVDLNTLIDHSSGWNLRWAYGINDAGQITGAGLIGGETHAFLLTPVVPEPGGLTLFGIGALAIGGLIRIRRVRARTVA